MWRVTPAICGGVYHIVVRPAPLINLASVYYYFLLGRPPMTPLASVDTSRCFPILLESSGTVLIDAVYRQVDYLMLI